MRPRAVLLSLTLAVAAACVASAQTVPSLATGNMPSLEAAVSNGTATRAQQIDLATMYLQAGRYYEASRLADRLLTADPNDATALSLRDRARTGLKSAAGHNVAAAEASLRSDATDANRLALANAYFDAGSYAAAADLYAHLPAPMLDRDMRLRQARALAWSGQHDASERAYSALLREQRTADLELEYGRLLSWMGASRAAVNTLTGVYRTSPSEESAIALANAEAWSGDRASAVRLLGDFIASHPEAIQAKLLRDQMNASPDLRIEEINRTMATEPYNLALRVERARLLTDAGRYAEALKDVRFVREHSSQKIDGLDAIDQRATAARQAELDRTTERLRQVDLRNAQSAPQIVDLAKAYSSLGEYQTAVRLYEGYLQLQPNDLDARVQYARVLSWDRRWAAAERQYEQVMQMAPDRADLKLEYAQVLSYDADFNGAMQMFSSLTDLSTNPRANLYPDVPERAHYNLGQIYRWYGWNDHAASEQNLALSLDDSYEPARQELDLVRHLRPSSELEGRYSYATDSSDFSLKRVDFTGAKWTSRRTGWNASLGRHEFSRGGTSISALAASGGLNYRWSDTLMARASVGANFYENAGSSFFDTSIGTRPFWGVGAQWMPDLASRFSADYNHYDLVYDVFTLNSLAAPAGTTTFTSADPLSIDDLRGHYDHNSGGFLSWLADASFGRVSDANKRKAAHGLVSVRLWKEPFIAVKADGRYLAYDFRTNRYWSPGDYKSIAGVLQIGQNIRNRVFWSVEGKLGKSWESGRQSDLRSYGANLTVPVSDRLDLVGSYVYGKSGRFDSVIGSSSTDFVNYWQRYWFAGVRVKKLFSRDDRKVASTYYYDNRSLTGSPVVPPLGETH